MNTMVMPVAVADSETISIGIGTGDIPVRAYPSEIPIFGQVHPRYRFNTPMVLTVERDDDGSYVLSDNIFAIYGSGFTITDAVRDYVSAFVEYYELLLTHQDAPTVALFRELGRYFQPVL